MAQLAKQQDARYQVRVNVLHGGKALPTMIGPAYPHPRAAQMLCEAIEHQIKLGKEKLYADPEVVRYTGVIN